LFEIDTASHVSHENKTLERPHVSSGRDHIDGDGDAKLR